MYLTFLKRFEAILMFHFCRWDWEDIKVSVLIVSNLVKREEISISFVRGTRRDQQHWYCFIRRAAHTGKHFMLWRYLRHHCKTLSIRTHYQADFKTKISLWYHYQLYSKALKEPYLEPFFDLTNATLVTLQYRKQFSLLTTCLFPAYY